MLFVGIGLFMVLLELLLGVETGLDLVFLGSAFILGGLISWPTHSWLVALIVTSAICAAYVAVGRRYVHRWTAARKYQTNVDTIVGKTGIVTQSISPTADGRIKVGAEDWKARAEEAIPQGTEVVVTGVSGVTLTVKKYEGENK